MKVRDLCMRSVRTCTPDTSLASAGWQMWEGDCGILPVVDEKNKLLGVLTDRDICIATATKDRPAARITAEEVYTGKVFSCRLNDDARKALEIMAKEAIRRLPVVDAEGRLEGIVSINDLTLAARAADRTRTNGITFEDLVPAIQAICAHRDGHLPAEKAALPAPSRVAVAT